MNIVAKIRRHGLRRSAQIASYHNQEFLREMEDAERFGIHASDAVRACGDRRISPRRACGSSTIRPMPPASAPFRTRIASHRITTAASAGPSGTSHADPQAVEYLCRDYDSIRSARYYDVENLMRRILNPIVAAGMTYNRLGLRNKTDFGNNIYCHFILEVVK